MVCSLAERISLLRERGRGRANSTPKPVLVIESAPVVLDFSLSLLRSHLETISAAVAAVVQGSALPTMLPHARPKGGAASEFEGARATPEPPCVKHCGMLDLDGAIFLVFTWLKMFELSCVLPFLKVVLSQPCFVALCLMHFFSPFSTPFPALARSPTTTPSLLNPSASPSTATPQGRIMLWLTG